MGNCTGKEDNTDLIPNMNKALEQQAKDETPNTAAPREATSLIESVPSGNSRAQERDQFKTEHPHQLKDNTTEEKAESKDVVKNTDKWATAKDIEIGEIESESTLQTSSGNMNRA